MKKTAIAFTAACIVFTIVEAILTVSLNLNPINAVVPMAGAIAGSFLCRGAR